MSKKLFVFVMVLSLVLIAASPMAPMAGAFTSYTSGFQVQNLSAVTANVTITYYNQDGTIATTASDTIAASGAKTYYPVHAAAGFNGSVVISSDQQIASVVNVLGSGAANAGASYVASMAGGTTVSLPLLMKANSGYNTWFNVQNTGSADATVNVAYSDGTAVGPITVKPGAAHTFDQAGETHSATVFSANVTSTQAVAVAVIEENPSTMFAYSGFAGGATNPVMPLVNANNGGYITGMQIQNAGGVATDVTVSYTPSATGTACTETQTIPAGQSVTFALGAFASGANSTCAAGVAFVGSAQVTGNTTGQSLVAIVNQLKPGVNGEAYGSFDSASATNTVVLPLIMDRNGGWYTGFNVMNVGAAATIVTCAFSGTAYTYTTLSLAPGQASTAIQNGLIASGYVGSATCTATNAGDKIVAVVNELNPAAGDNLLVYEGISK